MFYLTIRYFKANIHIEKLYKYLYNNEQDLSYKVNKKYQEKGEVI